jgi:cell division inhibitor SepF
VSVPTNHYSNKVLSLNPGAEKMDILNFTMTHYDMTGEVSDYIKKRKTVIVNMQKLDPKDIQRTVDYLTGTCYALNGTVEKIAESIFIFAPESVSISPETVKQKDMWHKI